MAGSVQGVPAIGRVALSGYYQRGTHPISLTRLQELEQTHASPFYTNPVQIDSPLDLNVPPRHALCRAAVKTGNWRRMRRKWSKNMNRR